MGLDTVNNILANALCDKDLVRSVHRALDTPRGLPKGAEFNIYRDKVRQLIGKPPEVLAAMADGMPFEEAVISEFVRPSLLVRNDKFDIPDSEVWRARLNRNRLSIESAFPSVGRIEIGNSPYYPWVGTGWLVAEDVVVTNRHVARLFAYESAGTYSFAANVYGEPFKVRIDFREEYEIPGAEEFPILRVRHIESMGREFPDLALMIVEKGQGLPDPLVLQGKLPEDGFVGVIGYPQRDPRNDRAAMVQVYGDIYEVKRFSPGQVVTFDNEMIFAHDCSTLGGNSGSPVIDLATGAAVGLHFGGVFRKANFAVRGAALMQRLSELNVRIGVEGPDGITPQIPPPAEELRTGYAPDFLGADYAVPLPESKASLRRKLVEVGSATGEARAVIDYIHYSLALHRERRLAVYAACNIDGAEPHRLKRTSDPWGYDARIAREFQTGNDLYRKNKLDRAHLVRRLDPMWGGSRVFASDAGRDTYWWTNCVPLHEELNKTVWLGLENYILDTVDAENIRISVFAGPLLEEDDPFYRRYYQVPQAYWKIVAFVDRETHALRSGAFLLRQDHLLGNLEFAFDQDETFQVPVSMIEGRTGLKFGPLARADVYRSLESLGPRPLRGLGDVLL